MAEMKFRATFENMTGPELRKLESDLQATEDALSQAGDEAEEFGDDVEEGVGRASDSAKEAKASFESLAIGSAAVAASLVLVIRGGISSAIQMERLDKAILANAGSAEAAAAKMTRLMEVARLPGLGLEEAIRGSLNLESVGINAEFAARLLEEMGNALARVGGGREDLLAVTLGMRKMVSEGKVLDEQLDVIAQRVPEVNAVLIKAFGSANARQIREAGVSVDQLLQVMVEGLSKLERVEGGTANALENLSDASFQAKAAFGDVFLPTLNLGVGVLSDLIEGFVELSETERAIVSWSVAGTAAFAAVVAGASTFIILLPHLIGGVKAFNILMPAFVASVRGGAAALLTMSVGPGAALVVAAAAVALLTLEYKFLKGAQDKQAEAQERSNAQTLSLSETLHRLNEGEATRAQFLPFITKLEAQRVHTLRELADTLQSIQNLEEAANLFTDPAERAGFDARLKERKDERDRLVEEGQRLNRELAAAEQGLAAAPEKKAATGLGTAKTDSKAFDKIEADREKARRTVQEEQEQLSARKRHGILQDLLRFSEEISKAQTATELEEIQKRLDAYLEAKGFEVAAFEQTAEFLKEIQAALNQEQIEAAREIAREKWIAVNQGLQAEKKAKEEAAEAEAQRMAEIQADGIREDAERKEAARNKELAELEPFLLEIVDLSNAAESIITVNQGLELRKQVDAFREANAGRLQHYQELADSLNQVDETITQRIVPLDRTERHIDGLRQFGESISGINDGWMALDVTIDTGVADAIVKSQRMIDTLSGGFADVAVAGFDAFIERGRLAGQAEDRLEQLSENTADRLERLRENSARDIKRIQEDETLDADRKAKRIERIQQRLADRIEDIERDSAKRRLGIEEKLAEDRKGVFGDMVDDFIKELARVVISEGARAVAQMVLSLAGLEAQSRGNDGRPGSNRPWWQELAVEGGKAAINKGVQEFTGNSDPQADDFGFDVGDPDIDIIGIDAPTGFGDIGFDDDDDDDDGFFAAPAAPGLAGQANAGRQFSEFTQGFIEGRDAASRGPSFEEQRLQLAQVAPIVEVHVHLQERRVGDRIVHDQRVETRYRQQGRIT